MHTHMHTHTHTHIHTHTHTGYKLCAGISLLDVVGVVLMIILVTYFTWKVRIHLVPCTCCAFRVLCHRLCTVQVLQQLCECVVPFIGLAITIYARCMYGNFGREITKYTVINGTYTRVLPTLTIYAVSLLLVLQQELLCVLLYAVGVGVGASSHIRCVTAVYVLPFTLCHSHLCCVTPIYAVSLLLAFSHLRCVTPIYAVSLPFTLCHCY